MGRHDITGYWGECGWAPLYCCPCMFTCMVMPGQYYHKNLTLTHAVNVLFSCSQLHSCSKTDQKWERRQCALQQNRERRVMETEEKDIQLQIVRTPKVQQYNLIPTLCNLYSLSEFSWECGLLLALCQYSSSCSLPQCTAFVLVQILRRFYKIHCIPYWKYETAGSQK